MDKPNISDVDSLGEDLEHSNFVKPFCDTKLKKDHKVVYFRLSRERIIRISLTDIKV
jgi:hypothetical protein